MKNKYLEMIENSQLRTDLPTFHPGDSVTVNVWVKEGDKARIQAFKRLRACDQEPWYQLCVYCT